MFAKLFENTKFGQILVKIDTHPEEHSPEVRVFFEPPDLGVCSTAFTFEDSEEGWDAAEKAFDKMDIVKVEKIVESIVKRTELFNNV